MVLATTKKIATSRGSVIAATRKALSLRKRLRAGDTREFYAQEATRWPGVNPESCPVVERASRTIRCGDQQRECRAGTCGQVAADSRDECAPQAFSTAPRVDRHLNEVCHAGTDLRDQRQTFDGGAIPHDTRGLTVHDAAPAVGQEVAQVALPFSTLVMGREQRR